MALEYSTLPPKPRKWWKLVLCVVLGLALGYGGLCFWAWWEFETLQIDVAVKNNTDETLHNVRLSCGPTLLLGLGDVAPGAKVAKSRRFYYDVGPTSFYCERGDQVYSGDSWLVLTGKGPYEYEIDVLPEKAHVERWSPPKGTWKNDLPARKASTAAP